VTPKRQRRTQNTLLRSHLPTCISQEAKCPKVLGGPWVGILCHLGLPTWRTHTTLAVNNETREPLQSSYLYICMHLERGVSGSPSPGLQLLTQITLFISGLGGPMPIFCRLSAQISIMQVFLFREPSSGLLPAPTTTRHSACHTHSPTVTWPT
jgi:hypothetical protein